MRFAALSVALAYLIVIGTVAAQTDGSAVESRIYCPCGCGEILINCHCDTALKAKKDIETKLLAGKKPEDIVNEYVKMYGPGILVNEELERIKAASKSNNFDAFPLYVVGVLATGFIAYQLGKSARRGDDWKVEKKR